GGCAPRARGGEPAPATTSSAPFPRLAPTPRRCVANFLATETLSRPASNDGARATTTVPTYRHPILGDPLAQDVWLTKPDPGARHFHSLMDYGAKYAEVAAWCRTRTAKALLSLSKALAGLSTKLSVAAVLGMGTIAIIPQEAASTLRRSKLSASPPAIEIVRPKQVIIEEGEQ